MKTEETKEKKKVIYRECKKCGKKVKQDGDALGTWFWCPNCYRTFGIVRFMA
jgi:predicted RNA-binding Zn-ribbon protein involved in translation (DUF1610 family)